MHSTFASRSFPIWLALVGATALASTGCGVPAPDPEAESGEPTGDRGDPVSAGTVEDAMGSTCVTSSVAPLSQQIIDEMRCMSPDALAPMPDAPNLTLAPNVFAYLEKPARDALVKALAQKPGYGMHVNSMFRTVAQQYLLYRWYQKGRCGIGLAAAPGSSNHETGLALDVQETSSWRSTLGGVDFDWLGSSDPVHYDYRGAGASSLKGLDVKAFQRLWNRNHPNDPIAEDGAWGPATRSRLSQSPAKGFAVGATCGQSPDPQTPDPQTPDPQMPADPQSCTDFPSADFTCAADGNGRGKCDAGQVSFEACANGCLIQPGADVCMGTTSSWSCGGTTGKAKMQNGDYVATSFGCWVDGNGVAHSDPGDNCVPACLATLQGDGSCSGMSGPACERHVNWYAADSDRFGCGARLRVTNVDNGKSVIVEVIDSGPACFVENDAGTGVVDLSNAVAHYLFGGEVGWSDMQKIHVVEVDRATPLGPL
jgi:hypothetical protein